MAVKILIKRRFKEGHFNEINRMLKKVRYGAMDEDGYLSSETLWDHEDPFRVVVASNWRSLDDWRRWYNSPRRKTDLDEFEKYLDGSTQYEVFDLGLYPH
ncbi:MAG: antibiotic biosynthesis monooxygenase [Desulfobacteraceae bacterium]|jgi:heme-degrading monooxygenase HmoA|nr:antibiotic biosynthesis monooxygenase [Desulfobacteraceae bacterium]